MKNNILGKPRALAKNIGLDTEEWESGQESHVKRALNLRGKGEMEDMLNIEGRGEITQWSEITRLILWYKSLDFCIVAGCVFNTYGLLIW